MKKLALICTLVGLISAGSAEAAVTLTFDELPTQPVDGLSYSGVTFGYTIDGVPSTDATYNGIGPGSLTYLQDSALEGNTQGVLTLDFISPIDQLEFGIALNTYSATTPGYAVSLFDESLVLVGTYYGDMNPLILWSEDQFMYSGASVSRAVIGFNEQVARRFAIDNLTFNTAADTGPVSTIPAPGAILLGSIGAGLVGWLRRRKTL